MKRCVECRRHLWVADAVCPFCEAPQGELPTAAVKPLLLAIGLATASCGPAVEELDGAADEGGSSSASTTTGSPGSTAPATTQSPSPSTSTTAEPPPGTTVSFGDTTGDAADDADSLSFLIYGGGDGGGGSPLECDLWTNDCPAGEKCSPWASMGGPLDATRCVEDPERPAQIGDTCVALGNAGSGINDCGAQAFCYGVNPETLEGRCVELCSGSPDTPICETPGTDCWLIEQLEIPQCLEPCDPLIPTCGNGHVCVVLDADDETSTVCLPQASETPVGDPCVTHNECETGFCAAGDTVPNCEDFGCCVPFCSTDDPLADETCDGSVSGTMCTAVFSPESMSTTGVCLAP